MPRSSRRLSAGTAVRCAAKPRVVGRERLVEHRAPEAKFYARGVVRAAHGTVVRLPRPNYPHPFPDIPGQVADSVWSHVARTRANGAGL